MSKIPAYLLTIREIVASFSLLFEHYAGKPDGFFGGRAGATSIRQGIPVDL